MNVLLGILVSFFTLIFMEAVTWFTHKYVMHGFLWYLHEDHHQPRDSSFFEKNDLFFIIFAVPSILLFYYGFKDGLNYLFFIGLVIFLYGLCYFIVHDVIIHQRFNWFKNVRWKYLQVLRKGHKMHHKNLYKEGGESFGMLFVPWKYFREKYKS